MQLFSIRGVHIDGIVACVPENKVDNDASLREMYGDEARLIVESTGIEARYQAAPGTSSSDLCIACAKDLMKGTGVKPEEIGGVIFITFTPDFLMPFNAALVQERLGLSQEIPAFDISLACSGYAYGLYVAAMFARASGKKVLLLDGDIQSAYLSGYDKSTVPVLSDGGSATMISPDGTDTEWTFSFYTDGSGKEALTIPAGGSAAPVNADDLEYQTFSDGSKRRNVDIKMDGFAVFKFVAMDVSKWLIRFMDAVNENAATLNYFIPHQPNMYMIKKLAKKLGFAWEKTWHSGEAVGNAGSASLPTTISLRADSLLHETDKISKVLISGFGAGLSASAGIITLNSIAYYKFFQYKGVEAKGQR